MAESESPNFIVTIDFAEDTENPARVFKAAEKLISAFEYIDEELVKTFQLDVDTKLLLGGIEEGSLRIILRNAILKIDDNELKRLDFKAIIGTFLIEAKKILLKKLEEEEGIKGPIDIQNVSKEIQDLAANTDIKHLPDYHGPSIQTVVNGIKLINSAKSELSVKDKLYAGDDKETIELKVSKVIESGQFDELSMESRTIESDIPATLVIKKPDYIGNSKWEFRSDRGIIHAKIVDQVWLEKFHKKEIRLHPGDAIECIMSVEVLVDADNRPLQTVYTVLKVVRVIEGDWRQVSMLFAS